MNDKQLATLEVISDHEHLLCVDGQKVIPESVQIEMVGKLQVHPKLKVAVMYSPALALRMVYLGFKKVKLVVGTVTPAIERLSSLGIDIITIEEYKETGMKFDLTLGNPPYSLDQGNKLLYPEFFEMSLEKSDHVMMVMPIKLDSRDNKIKAHNMRVLTHQTFISEDISESFKGIGVGRISYVIASKAVKNEVAEVAERILPPLLPRRNRLRVINGKAFTQVTGGHPVIHKVLKGGIVEGACSDDDAKKFRAYYKKKTTTDTPWLVMINHTPSKGVFNAEIVKFNKSLIWSRWTYAIQAKTKKEANDIIAHLRSKKVVDYLNNNMTSHTISISILQALPWYK